MADPADTGKSEFLAAAGKKLRVEYAVLDDGTMPAKDFINDQPPSTQTRILASFAHVAQNGFIGVSDKIFCHERDEISTFKCKLNKLRLRLPCFRHGNRLIVTHGFVKPPKSEWDEQEFSRANQIRVEVLNREKKEQQQQSQGRGHHGK